MEQPEEEKKPAKESSGNLEILPPIQDFQEMIDTLKDMNPDLKWKDGGIPETYLKEKYDKLKHDSPMTQVRIVNVGINDESRRPYIVVADNQEDIEKVGEALLQLKMWQMTLNEGRPERSFTVDHQLAVNNQNIDGHIENSDTKPDGFVSYKEIPGKKFLEKPTTVYINFHDRVALTEGGWPATKDNDPIAWGMVVVAKKGSEQAVKSIYNLDKVTKVKEKPNKRRI